MDSLFNLGNQSLAEQSFQHQHVNKSKKETVLTKIFETVQNLIDNGKEIRISDLNLPQSISAATIKSFILKNTEGRFWPKQDILNKAEIFINHELIILNECKEETIDNIMTQICRNCVLDYCKLTNYITDLHDGSELLKDIINAAPARYIISDRKYKLMHAIDLIDQCLLDMIETLQKDESWDDFDDAKILLKDDIKFIYQIIEQRILQ